MKTIIKLTLSLLFIAASFTSCVDDKDFDTPQVSCDNSFISEISEDDIIPFQNVVENYTGGFYSFTSEDNYFIGYVVSNDLDGNFYKELYIQDKVENPTYSIKLNIDMRGLYTRYPIGSKLYIKTEGLAIDKSRGELIIGEDINGVLENIRPKIAEVNIHRACNVETIVAKEINSSTEIDESLLGMYIQLKGVQFDFSLFNDDNKGEPYVDPADSYDSHRKIVFCSDESVITLETSIYAGFGETKLPYAKFDITGVLSRDYGDDFYVLKLNSLSGVEENDSERCDPSFLDCGNNAVGGSVVVFEDDFESYSNNTTNLAGWTNVNVNGGNKVYKVKSYSGNKYLECSAYNSNENPLEVWAVTPAINLDATIDEELTFKTKAHHDNGKTLNVYVSTDFSGDITTATWSLVNANIGTSSQNGYGNFENSGSINLSCLDGDVYVAFKYEGGDGGITTTMQIDDVKVTGN